MKTQQAGTSTVEVVEVTTQLEHVCPPCELEHSGPMDVAGMTLVFGMVAALALGYICGRGDR